MAKLTAILTYSDPVWDSVNKSWTLMVDTLEMGIMLFSFESSESAWELHEEINDSHKVIMMEDDED